LVFKSLLSFEINFALGKLIHGPVIFSLEIFNFCEQILLLTLRVSLLFVKSFVFVFDLMQQGEKQNLLAKIEDLKAKYDGSMDELT
jgi:hypothetical protein